MARKRTGRPPGRPPIPANVREQLRELLRGGLLSGQEIADRLGISRARVHAEKKALFEADGEPPILAPGESYVAAGIRCTGCGGLVYVIPCRFCRVQRHLAAQRDARVLGTVDAGPPAKRTAVKQAQLEQAPLRARSRPLRRRGRWAPLLDHFRARQPRR